MGSRIILICVLSLFVLSTVVNVVANHHGAREMLKLPQKATLRDGVIITLEGVTYGKERQFRDMKIDPSSGGQPMQLNSSDAIILWMRNERPAGSEQQVSIGPTAIHIFDDAGKERIAYEYRAQAQVLSENRQAVLLYSWPRRGSFFTVEVGYGSPGPDRSYVKFRLPTPRTADDKPFTPSQTPIVRANSELEVTLADLVQVPPVTATSEPPDYVEKLSHAEKLHTAVDFRYKYHGQATKNWLPTKAVITDSTGNIYLSEASSLYQPPVRALTYYRSDNDEPLKLGVWFQRTADADFAPEETGTVTKMQFKQDDSSILPNAPVQVGEITVKLVAISEVECEGKRTELLFNVYGGDPQLSLMLQVKNEKGEAAHGIGPNARAKWITGFVREPDGTEKGGTEAKPHRCASFLLDMPQGTSHFTFTIAINRAHYFEFTPNPTVSLTPLPVSTR